MKSSLLSLSFGNFAVGIGSLVIAGVIGLMATDLGVSVAEAGQLITVYAVVYAISSPLLAALTASLSRRAVLVIGLVLMFAGNVLGAFAPGYALMVLARGVLALGAGMFTPTAISVAVALSEPHRRGQAITFVFGGFTIATAFGVPIGTFFGANVGWRITLGLVAVLSLLAATWTSRAVPAQAPVPHPNLRAWGEVFRSPRLLLATLVTVFQLTAQFIVFTYLAPTMQAFFGMDPRGGLYLTLGLSFGVASIAGNFVGGYSAGKIGARNTLLWMLAVLTLVCLLYPAMLGWASLPLAFILTMIWGVVGLGFNAPQQIRLVGLAPSLQSVMLALNASALYVGIAAGAFIGGQVVTSSGGYGNLGWWASGVAAVAILTLVATWAAERRVAPDGNQAAMT